MKYILILGTLDTKGAEVDFLRRRVLAEGGRPLVIDTGVLHTATVPADIDRDTVARAGGGSISGLIEGRDKARAIVVMADGASRILSGFLEREELGGVLSIGGSRGTALGTRVMQTLPVGVPKLMVSTMASGQNIFGPYVGTRDVTLMHSVADIQGLNAITRPIFTNAAAAIVGMSRTGAVLEKGERPIFTASMLGVSTALVGQVQGLMEAQGAEVIAFHANGTGGRSMEELAAGGLVAGVFDLTLGEMTQFYTGSPSSPGQDRLLAAGRRGIPQVAAPGGVDFIIEGPLEGLPEKYRGRKIMPHTPTITLVRTSKEEMAAVGELIAGRLSASTGPVSMILPREAFGWFAMQGQPLYDPESDDAFIQALKEHAGPQVQITELDTHLNDPQVGDLAVTWMMNSRFQGQR